jgi:tetratricopeptide (TPR) repeat protein
MWDHGLITSDTQYWTHGLDDWYLVANLLEVETGKEMGDPSGQTSDGYQTSPASNAPNLPQNVVAMVEQSSNHKDRGSERKPAQGVDAPKQKLRLGCFRLALAIVALIAVAVWYNATTHFQQRPSAQAMSDDSRERRASNELIKEGAKHEVVRVEGRVVQLTYPAAISYYTKAIEADSQNPAAYFARGMALFRETTETMNPGDVGRREKMNQMIDDFGKCLEIDSTTANDYYAAANAYYNRSLALATRANWGITEQTGDAAEELKDLEDARRDYAKALELRPERADMVKDAEDRARKIYEDTKSKFEDDERKATPSQNLDRMKKFNDVMIETQLALEDVYQRWQEVTLYQSNDWMSPLQAACLKQRVECESIMRVKAPPEYEEEFAMVIEEAKAFDKEAAAYLQFLNAFTMRNVYGADDAFRTALQAGIRAHQMNSLRESWWKAHP